MDKSFSRIKESFPTSGSAGVGGEDFVRYYSIAHSRIYRFILTLVPTRNDADEVMQETSLVLWRKFSQYNKEKDFTRWACGIARIEVLRLFQDKKRFAKLFDNELLEQLASTYNNRKELLDIRHEFLEECKENLSAEDLHLVGMAYSTDVGMKLAASILNKPLSTLYRHLGRIKNTLFKCVEKKMGSEGNQ